MNSALKIQHEMNHDEINEELIESNLYEEKHEELEEELKKINLKAVLTSNLVGDDFDIVQTEFNEVDEEIVDDIEREKVFDNTIKEEKALDEEAFLTEEEKTVIFESNQGLLHSIVNAFLVKSFSPYQYQRDDLIGAGQVGFTKALNSYKKNKNTKFTTYATKCITNEILYFLRKENKHNQVVHMEKPIATDKNGNNLTIMDLLEDESTNIEASVLEGESLNFLLEIVQGLNFNENFIIIHRYGLFGKECKTQKEIADILGMSQANISKLETNILEKIKKILMSKYGIKDINFGK